MKKMSLQDESFPADDLFDQLNYSTGLNCGPCSLSRQGSESKHHEPEVIALGQVSPPFSNSHCSEHSYTEAANTSGKTCVSDPTGLDQADGDDDNNHRGHVHGNAQLSTGRSSKAISYQDIHTADTKRRFKHVASKVGQYIAAIHAEEQKRRGSATKFQRHRSMPETLTPKAMPREVHYSVEELHELNQSGTNSSDDRDDSYERLQNETQRIQCYNNYLQTKLDEKMDEIILLKRNFNVVRIELSDCKDKLKRQTSSGITQQRHSLHSLNSLLYCPMGVSKATQTDQPPAAGQLCSIANLSDMTEIGATATPHPSGNLNNAIVEAALLNAAVAPAHGNANSGKKSIAAIQPLSLNFSNDSAEVDANGNAASSGGEAQPGSSNRIATNNSGSSHPSSNDSAIEVEGIELRSPAPAPLCRHQSVAFMQASAMPNRRECIYYFDKRRHRVIEMEMNGNTNMSRLGLSLSSTAAQISGSSADSTVHFARKKQSLRARMLRLLGPCVRCQDPNQSLDTTTATYSVIPLLEESYIRGRT